MDAGATESSTNDLAGAPRELELHRALVALRTSEGVYLSWRLLASDPWDQRFDVYRLEPDGAAHKLTEEPVRRTTDFFDGEAPAGKVTYRVYDAPLAEITEATPFTEATASAEAAALPYVAIKLQDPAATIQRVALVDLDGDRRLDYLVKTPRDSIDPAPYYWKPSPNTYKIEAYRHDGTFLWQHDLGWAIERGVWYSPFVAWDLEGDGKAEWAAKIGDGDPRDADGRVTSGAEWLAVFDGLTGKELARAPWPDRDGFREVDNYSVASRNQIAIAYLDGKNPSILALRGTYGRMKAIAYAFEQGELRQLWSYDTDDLDSSYRGQGAHTTYCFDADGDGRDEVLLGSVLLDDTGVPLWNTGLKHPDFVYVGDHDPNRPGLEIFYGIETKKDRNGLCMVDPKTGDILWGLTEPTNHIHGRGLCSDIDPLVPGNEGFGLDSVSKQPVVSKGPWLFSAAGELLWFDKPFLPRDYSIEAVHWDADLQRETIYYGKISDYQGPLLATLKGSLIDVADVLGDWREEVMTSQPGELRIYSTTIPARDRRVCLLQDRLYRFRTLLNTSGYYMVANLSYQLEAHWPNLNVTLLTGANGALTGRAVVSAPLTATVQGTLVYTPGPGGSPTTWDIDLAPGTRTVLSFPVEASARADAYVKLTGNAHYGVVPLAEGTPIPPDFSRQPLVFTTPLEFSARF